MSTEPDLKRLTARSMKWNLIDRCLSIALYTAIGIVLARELSKSDFGLVGIVLVFQAFAVLFVDSGLSYALIQRRSPSRLDYSTVLWFNLGSATAIYCLLWLCAPLIAEWYGQPELINLSRVTFLSFIFNATSIVQTNRLMKQKNVAPIAASNTVGLIAGGTVAIVLAYKGYGAWAVVWQTNVLNFVKSVMLWAYSRWTPLLKFSFTSMRSFFAVGSSMMTSSFLNVIFQNVYTMVIGLKGSITQVGLFTQADKWSKMGVSSICQVLTSSFLPTLSDVNDDDKRFSNTVSKMNRAGSYLLMPAMGFVIVIATPLFHVLFGTKWDDSIILFQILLLRGVFTTMTSLYNNYIIARGHARMIIGMELLRDVSAGIALVASLPFIPLSTVAHPVLGIEILLWGQLASSVIVWIVTIWYTAPLCNRQRKAFIADSIPYAATTLAGMAVMWCIPHFLSNDVAVLASQIGFALIFYLGVNTVLGSRVQRDMIDYLLHRNRN